MSYLDARIKELATDTEQHLLRSSQPHGWLGLVRAMRAGRLAWIFWISWVVQLALFVLAVIWGLRFFAATDALAALKSGLPATTALILAVQIKTSMAPHLHSERILRALKRIEILVLARHEIEAQAGADPSAAMQTTEGDS
ncbi:DUF6768 family protein [Maliponia aquimaris]|uniref:Uncharacterized protein n=1 Tax=Maliponia aquimaris TaxID=1673631 RepID=A0A238KTR6_9RHOB|nr:DUF6768 family protein [Maliponia aquimaris]SMX46223.1 hypothetical protein MAA8898_03366 [Maliponia aquimaris]